MILRWRKGYTREYKERSMTHHAECIKDLIVRHMSLSSGDTVGQHRLIANLLEQVSWMAGAVDQLVEAKVDDIMNDPDPYIPPETAAVAAMDLAVVRSMLLERALGKITEIYPPSNPAGKIAADALTLLRPVSK